HDVKLSLSGESCPIKTKFLYKNIDYIVCIVNKWLNKKTLSSTAVLLLRAHYHREEPLGRRPPQNVIARRNFSFDAAIQCAFCLLGLCRDGQSLLCWALHQDACDGCDAAFLPSFWRIV
ncbi:MAG: hypothetical protein ACPG7U_02185, partial [Holosporaceae bacterium]